MNMQAEQQDKLAWTWADQISTYRFWGILVFFFASTLSLTALTSFLIFYLETTIKLPVSQSAITLSLLAIGGLLGFYITWIAARSHTKSWLIVFGIIQLLGGLFLTVPGLASIASIRMTGAFMVGLAAGSITLSVPSILAGGRGGMGAFVVVFGLIVFFSRLGEMQNYVILGTLLDNFGHGTLPVIITTFIILGLIFLLPVKSSLFQAAPPERGYSLTPDDRHPLLVGILCFIPLYWLYWLYRAHGEVASIAPTRSILSPTGAVLACFFVPLLTPIVVVSLVDALNQPARELGKPVFKNSWIVFIGGLIFFPLAAGFVQYDLNKALKEIEAS
jgi:MFS family permease